MVGLNEVTARRLVLRVCLCWSAILSAPRSAGSQGIFEQAVQGNLGGVNNEASEVLQAPEGGTKPMPGVFVSNPQADYDLTGYVRSALFVGKAAGSNRSEVKAGYGETALGVRTRAGTYGDAYAELRVQADRAGSHTEGRASLREAFVNLYLGPFDLRIGHQIIAWGRADGINPTDNLTSFDMNVRSTSEDDRRRGSLALRTFLNANQLRIEAVWVPAFGPSIFPSFENGAWQDRVRVDEERERGLDLRDGVGAARFHLQTASFEGSVSILGGTATFPGLGLLGQDGDPTDDGTLIVGFSPYRHMVIGADFSAPVPDLFGIRGEAAFRRPLDYRGRDDVPLPDLQVVVGVDREFFHSLMVICQYVGRRVFDFDRIRRNRFLSGEASPSAEEMEALLSDWPDAARIEIKRRNRIIHDQKKEINHGWMFRLEYSLLRETLNLELSGLYFFSSAEYLLQPRLRYSISDALVITAGGDLYGGGDDTLFGMVDDVLNAGFVELRAVF